MSDLRCTEKARYEPRQRAFLREQNANALAIVVAEELPCERDNSARLLGGVDSDEKMHFVQILLFSRLSVSLACRSGTGSASPKSSSQVPTQVSSISRPSSRGSFKMMAASCDDFTAAFNSGQSGQCAPSKPVTSSWLNRGGSFAAFTAALRSAS